MRSTPLPHAVAGRREPRWRSGLVHLGCALGCLALLAGLATHGVTLHRPKQVLVPLAAGLLVALALAVAARSGWRWVAAVVLGSLLLAFGPGALATLLLTAATALALGLLGFGAPAGQGALGLLLRIALGLGLLAAGLQLAVRLPVNWAPVYLGVAALAMLAARRDLARIGASVWAAMAAPVPSGGERVAIVLLLAAMLVAGLPAAMPETGYDALSNHLAVVGRVSWAGAWHFEPERFDRALMPRAAGWLFAWAHVLGGEPAMKLLNAAALWLTAAIVLAYAAGEAEPAPRPLMLLALFSLAVTPLTVWVMTQLFEETLATLFLTAALAAVALAWRGLPQPASEALVPFLLLGIACAAKVQALFMGGIGLAAVLALLRGGRPLREALALACGGTALFAAVGLLPYAHAFWATGSPFFPFTLGTPPDPAWIGKATPDLPLRMAFATSEFMDSRDGALGFQHLVLAPALLVAGLLCRRAEARMVAAVLALFVAGMVSQTQYARYMFYAMPGLLLLLGPAWALLGPGGGVRGRPAPGRVLLAAGLVLATLLNIVSYRAIYVPPLRPETLLHPERLARGVPEERAVVAAINATHGPAARVYFAGLPFIAGLRGEAITVYAPLRHALDRAEGAAEALALLRAQGVTHVVTATDSNVHAAPVPLSPSLAAALDGGGLQEIPLALDQVRLFAVPPAPR